jgi:DNA-binding CsgD family transcriptional regulator
VALGEVAAQLPHLGELLGGPHAFGDHKNNGRFGKPVRESWNTRCLRRSFSVLRSVMSVRMPCQYTGLPSSPRTILSSRQKEILGLVGEGLSNAQIAERLFLSESTIKQHLRAAHKVLGANNRTEAVRLIRSR